MEKKNCRIILTNAGENKQQAAAEHQREVNLIMEDQSYKIISTEIAFSKFGGITAFVTTLEKI